MRALLAVLIVFACAFALGGCAETPDPDQAGDYNTFNPTPEKPDDGHGWGVGIQKQGG